MIIMIQRAMPPNLPFVLLALLVVVNGQVCITANNTNGLPKFQDYNFESELNTNIIPRLHQAIIPSYRFSCCGNITEWGVDVEPAVSRFNNTFTLDLQVWRPSPTVETTGCYRLVGNNSFTSVALRDRVAMVTPLPQQRIQFQPGDVLGFYVENARRENDGIVLLSDLNVRGDNRYETEEVWYARHPEFSSISSCPYPVGSSQVLNTFNRAAPVITPIIYSMDCPHTTSPLHSSSVIMKSVKGITQRSKNGPDIVPTPADFGSQMTKIHSKYHSMTSTTVNQPPQSDTNIGLISGVATTIALVVIVLVQTLIVVGAITMCRRNHHKIKVPTISNEAYGAVAKNSRLPAHTQAEEEDTYDYVHPLTTDQQVMDSINTTQNEAYGTIVLK